MTILSVRRVAEQCLGHTGDVSINNDLYGYIFREDDGSIFGTREDWEILLGSGTTDYPTARSLRRHLETVSGTSVDIVLWLVGMEPDFVGGAVSRDDATKAQYAVQQARDILAQIDLGIRGVSWRRIGFDEADEAGYISIESDGEAKRLFRDYSSPGEGQIDVFLVQIIDVPDTTGLGPAPKGPCDKKGRRSGVAVELLFDRMWCGHTIAHEICHYLGLGHVKESGNLMCGHRNWPAEDCQPSYGSNRITADQAAELMEHCVVKPPC